MVLHHSYVACNPEQEHNVNLRHDGAPVVALMRCCWGVAAAVDAAQPESVEPEMTECASGDVALGTLNLLGDAYNPFEFLALDDGDFCAVCDRFEQVLATLTWRDLREAHGLGDLAGALGGGAVAAIAALEGDGGAVLAKMDEVALALDNKRFEHRFNPLVFAMRRFAVGAATQSSDGAAPMVWEIVSDESAAAAAAAACDGAKDGAAPPWWRVLLRCCVKGGTYAEAPSLLVWDLLCGAVAASDAAAYRRTCEESYLNPRLVDRHAGIFADAVAGLGPRAAVGFQEFPARETARCAAFERAFAAAGLALARAEASSCVLAYRGFGGAAPELVADGCGAIAANASAASVEANREMHAGMAVDVGCDHAVDFSRMMIPHHSGAVRMCEILLEHEPDVDDYLENLCANISRTQRAEVAWLYYWLEGRGLDVAAPCEACDDDPGQPERPCEDMLSSSLLCSVRRDAVSCDCAVLTSQRACDDVLEETQTLVSAECERSCGLCPDEHAPLFFDACPNGADDDGGHHHHHHHADDDDDVADVADVSGAAAASLARGAALAALLLIAR